MSTPAPDGFSAALDAIPLGTTEGTANGRRYVTTRSIFNNGRSVKLVAEALGDDDYISLNFYDLTHGARLAPCEMPAQKVIDFVTSYRVD